MLGKTIMWQFSRSDLDCEYWDRIDAIAPMVVLVPSSEMPSGEMGDTEVLLVKLGHIVDRVILDSAPSLKYIGVFGTDTSRIDTVLAAQRGISVRNAANYSTEAVAEFAIALALDHYRKLSEARRASMEGRFSNEPFLGREIKGRTWGVVGCGRIGGRIATLALAFGASVLYYDTVQRNDVESLGGERAELGQLLRTSDIVSLNLPLTAGTAGTISADRVEIVKNGALLLVMAPVELIDLKVALKRAAANEITIALNHSYELDEAEVEQLRTCRSCVLLPPISFLTEESRRARQELFVSGLEQYVSTRKPNEGKQPPTHA